VFINSNITAHDIAMIDRFFRFSIKYRKIFDNSQLDYIMDGFESRLKYPNQNSDPPFLVTREMMGDVIEKPVLEVRNAITVVYDPISFSSEVMGAVMTSRERRSLDRTMSTGVVGWGEYRTGLAECSVR
jgi:hypothetical protein